MEYVHHASWEVSIPQDEKAVNFGRGCVRTFGLINCIAVGGIVRHPTDEKLVATFMTHRSPDRAIELVQDVWSCVMTIERQFGTTRLSPNDQIFVFGIEEAGRGADTYAFRGKNFAYSGLLKKLQQVFKKDLACEVKTKNYGWYNKRYLENKDDPRLKLCGTATVRPEKGSLTYFDPE